MRLDMNARHHDIAATESLLAFWRDAGIDACYVDEPVDHTLIAPPASVRAMHKAAVPAATPARTAPARGADTAQAAAEARRQAAGAATLQDLAAAVAAFEGCPLRGLGATQSVFGRGNPDAPVMIIGEAPGADEDRIGQPFVGRAGRLLDRMLAAAGLTDRVFITNTVFWRPPGNRTPTPQEQAVCAPFVERALALLKPRAVLLLGASSARAVLHTEDGVMKLRGRWKEWRASEGGLSVPVMPTLHPAFLLRQPQAKGMVWADLLSLSIRLETDSVEDHD